MKKKLITLIALGMLIALVFAYTQYNKPHRDVASEKADFTLTANELFDAFDENEIAANAKYLDKVIEVSGSLLEVNKDQKGNVVYTLEAENALLGGLLCTLKETDGSNNLEMNANINLKCRCTGFLEDVILVDCTRTK